MNPNATVLIVNDEKFIRDILTRIIRREGFSVDIANDGLEAYNKILQGNFDFVISDINMPNLNGMELLDKVKKINRDISFLLITSRVGKYSPKDVLKAGADFFITKPFKNAEIAHILRTLEIKRLRRIKAKMHNFIPV